MNEKTVITFLTLIVIALLIHLGAFTFSLTRSVVDIAATILGVIVFAGAVLWAWGHKPN